MPDIHARAADAHDLARAEENDDDHEGIEAELHQRVVERKDFLGAGEVAAHVVGRPPELLALMILPDETLDDAHSAHVLLDRLIESVVFAEHAGKKRRHLPDDQEQEEPEERNQHRIDDRHAPAEGKRHDERKNDHQRRADRGTDNHHERHLYVADVGRHTRDKRRGRKFVNVLEREILHAAEKIAAQIPREAGGRRGAGRARPRTEQEREEGKHDQHDAPFYNDIEPAPRLDLVNERGNDERDDTVDRDLKDDEQHRHDGRLLVFPHAFQYFPNHSVFPLFSHKQ